MSFYLVSTVIVYFYYHVFGRILQQCFQICSHIAADMLPSCDDVNDHDGMIAAFSNTEFGSPLQVTPIFRSLSTAVPSPSPKFSESVSCVLS